ncbi:hypothetical protein CVT25_015076 [Psilocybe cyanescens]|uniref:Uncharacterized protein n=1 Tax=Psilocybe cyanescens TaxID=93625 RepID=A0A409WS37_PSICY|nr:hypothetical protein CVT25_015076 [Psilocybe cyanescens]
MEKGKHEEEQYLYKINVPYWNANFNMRRIQSNKAAIMEAPTPVLELLYILLEINRTVIPNGPKGTKNLDSLHQGSLGEARVA